MRWTDLDSVFHCYVSVVLLSVPFNFVAVLALLGC